MSGGARDRFAGGGFQVVRAVIPVTYMTRVISAIYQIILLKVILNACLLFPYITSDLTRFYF